MSVRAVGFDRESVCDTESMKPNGSEHTLNQISVIVVEPAVIGCCRCQSFFTCVSGQFERISEVRPRETL